MVRFIDNGDLRRWHATAPNVSDWTRGLGPQPAAADYLEQTFGLPLHLSFAIRRLTAERAPAPLSADALAAIPFYSLCRGLFLPLSGITPEKAALLFGIATEPPPDAGAREALLAAFLEKPVGLSLAQKLACVLGDPFFGKPSTFRRDSLLRLLASLQLTTRRQLLDRLTAVGEIAALFAERVAWLRADPPLTAAEVLETLRLLPDERRSLKLALLRSLFSRCGKLEAYFLARLVLRKAGLGFDYQGPLIARKLAAQFAAPEEQVAHAIALTDVFHVARALAAHGVDGLRAIQLQPLSPVRPALAGGTVDEIKTFPVWVERKYDGIRLMLHRSSDARGSVICGAYTRNRGDWLESVSGLDATIKLLPCREAIVDGELHGSLVELEGGARPASVYEVYGALQGERMLQLKYAAFDLIYLDGEDLTRLPLLERRRRLSLLFAPLIGLPLPVPLSIADGQLAQHKDDLSRLYHHFRAQGYEGVIAKQPDAPYALAARDPGWTKRKPEVTLDLVLLGAVFAVTTKERAGVFGSYVIGARDADGAFAIVGDVAGVDRVRDAELQAEIMREGLLTGERIERQSASGTRPGVGLRPHIVVTIKFEGITRDQASGALRLRDPKLALIRADKPAHEADSLRAIEELYLRQRVA